MSYGTSGGDIEDDDLEATPRSQTPVGSSAFGRDDLSEGHPSTTDYRGFDDHGQGLSDEELVGDDGEQNDGLEDVNEIDLSVRNGEFSDRRRVYTQDLHGVEVEDDKDNAEMDDLDAEEEQEEEDKYEMYDRDSQDNADVMTEPEPGKIEDGLEEDEDDDDGATADDDGATADDDEDVDDDGDGRDGSIEPDGDADSPGDYDSARYSYGVLKNLYPEGLAYASHDGRGEDEEQEEIDRKSIADEEEKRKSANRGRSSKEQQRLSPGNDTGTVGEGDGPAEYSVHPGRPQRRRRRPQRWEGSAPVSNASHGVPARASTSNAKSSAAVGATMTSGSGRSRGAKSSAGGRDVDRTSRVGAPAPSKRLPSVREEEISTVSIQSAGTSSPPPELVDPVECVQGALESARSEADDRHGGPQAVIARFHEWQLKAISAEANHQKALHSYLKRKLRKRAVRLQEYERMEEDALRNACSAVPRLDPLSERGTEADLAGESGDATGGHAQPRRQSAEGVPHGKKQRRMEDVVPSVVRLPLEAYLPRRVCKARAILTLDQLLQSLPRSPRKKPVQSGDVPHRRRKKGHPGVASGPSKRRGEKRARSDSRRR